MDVISGDDHDLRFTDPHGKIIGLEAKGKAKHDNSGFVVKVKSESEQQKPEEINEKLKKDIVDVLKDYHV